MIDNSTLISVTKIEKYSKQRAHNTYQIRQSYLSQSEHADARNKQNENTNWY